MEPRGALRVPRGAWDMQVVRCTRQPMSTSSLHSSPATHPRHDHAHARVPPRISDAGGSGPNASRALGSWGPNCKHRVVNAEADRAGLRSHQVQCVELEQESPCAPSLSPSGGGGGGSAIAPVEGAPYCLGVGRWCPLGVGRGAGALPLWTSGLRPPGLTLTVAPWHGPIRASRPKDCRMRCEKLV